IASSRESWTRAAMLASAWPPARTCPTSPGRSWKRGRTSEEAATAPEAQHVYARTIFVKSVAAAALFQIHAVAVIVWPRVSVPALRGAASPAGAGPLPCVWSLLKLRTHPYVVVVSSPATKPRAFQTQLWTLDTLTGVPSSTRPPVVEPGGTARALWRVASCVAAALAKPWASA